MVGILNGLRAVCVKSGVMEGFYSPTPCMVVTDNESMTYFLTPGQKFKSKINQDLIYLREFYFERLNLWPVWVPRNTHPYQRAADAVCTDVRIAMKAASEKVAENYKEFCRLVDFKAGAHESL